MSTWVAHRHAGGRRSPARRLRDAALRRLLRAGLDVRRARPDLDPSLRLRTLLDLTGVDVALDVGACTGGFGRLLRSLGYRGTIVSFEPLRDAFAELSAAAADDPAWTVVRCAIGSHEGQVVLNRARNLSSSSVLPMLGRHLEAAPESGYVATEEVEVRRLDDVAMHLLGGSPRILMKVDVQGFEEQVLDGAGAVLQQAVLVQLELSLTPVYAGGSSYLRLLERMDRAGFAPVSIEPVLVDARAGRVLQVDAVFARDEDR